MEILFAFRTLLKRPFLNLVKIAGLSLALAGIILILLYLKNELSFDRIHKKSDRIYRFTVTSIDVFDGKHFARVYSPDYIPAMAEYFPEISSYVRLVPVRGGVIKLNENFLGVDEAFQCDSTFFKVFDCELVSGNAENVLNQPGIMVISQSYAKRLFGDKNPIGQVLTLPEGQFYGKNLDLTIKAIMKDFPPNSHFHPQFIATATDKDEFKDWAWTYLLFSPKSHPEDILKGFKKFVAIHSGIKESEVRTEAHLQPVTAIHLHSDKLREIEPNNNLFVIYTLSAAALILLFIAMINYINLNMGMAIFSDKYLELSKVFGSSRMANLKYYMTEGLIITVASIVMCLLMIIAAHLVIMDYFSINLVKDNSLFILVIIVLFGLFSMVPGILLFLKGNSVEKRTGIRKELIVFQYAISTALVIAVIVIMRQTGFALKNSMGKDAGNLVCFENVHAGIQQKFDIFKEELLKYNTVLSVSAMLDPPGGEANDMFAFKMEGYAVNEGEKSDSMIGILPCDYSFARVFNLRFLGGSDFTPRNVDSEGSGEYIINESAMRRLHYADPEQVIGKSFVLKFDDEAVKIPSGKIIGVVEDFHLSGIKKKVEPLVLFKRKNVWLINMVVSYKPGMQKKAMADIDKVWKELFPEYPFDYRDVGAIYRGVYRSEILQSRLLFFFTCIALFISSMGLLGMSLLTTQRRTKEIGIRIVNGASVREILTMLNWYYVKWIVISIVIAFPLAWITMHKWLGNFAYKTPLSWWIFALAGFLTVIIALVTVSVQSLKAANRNPVESLRYE